MLDIAQKSLTEKKAVDISSKLLSDGRELLEILKKREHIVPHDEFTLLVQKCVKFQEVIANLDSNKEFQNGMIALSLEIKEECDWRCGMGLLSDFAEWLNSQWCGENLSDFNVTIDDKAKKMFDLLKVRGQVIVSQGEHVRMQNAI